METRNTKINYKGDIGFLFFKSHLSFNFRPGCYYKLNQKFIDEYQLIQGEYGRICSRGKDYIKVEFLRSCPALYHEKGKIVSVKPETIQEFELISRGFVKIIFEDLPKVKVVAEKDKIFARLLKPVGNRAENVGSILHLTEDEAEVLLDSNSIQILPDDYKEPVITKPVFQASDYAPVICINPHPEYAYAPGGTGFILKKQLPRLLSEGYFDINATDAKEKAKILFELGFQKDPVTGKILR